MTALQYTNDAQPRFHPPLFCRRSFLAVVVDARVRRAIQLACSHTRNRHHTSADWHRVTQRSPPFSNGRFHFPLPRAASLSDIHVHLQVGPCGLRLRHHLREVGSHVGPAVIALFQCPSRVGVEVIDGEALQLRPTENCGEEVQVAGFATCSVEREVLQSWLLLCYVAYGQESQESWKLKLERCWQEHVYLAVQTKLLQAKGGSIQAEERKRKPRVPARLPEFQAL